MEFKGLSLEEAADSVVEGAPRGTVGLVAVSPSGEVTMPFNTTDMFRACATEDRYSEIGIWSSMPFNTTDMFRACATEDGYSEIGIWSSVQN
ncbi:hypothetical protein ACOSP7_026039 [Xanthoceras sorbifolium]